MADSDSARRWSQRTWSASHSAIARSVLVAPLWLGACGSETSSSNQPAGSGGGLDASPGIDSAGSANSGSGGTSATVGDSAAESSSAGSSGAGGAGLGGDGGSGHAATGDASGAADTSGTIDARSIADASGAIDARGTGGTDRDGADPTTCTRDILRTTVVAYFAALAAHDASTLPLAGSVKFTENGKVMKLGEEGMWKTAGAVKYAQSALDVELCSSATQAVVAEGNVDIPVALRLMIQNQKITEVETIAVRAGDYKLNGQTYASNTAAIIAVNDSVKWEEPVAAAQRNSRADLVAWIDKYFRAFPRGVCNTVSSCRRLENGYGSFECASGASCDPGKPSGQAAMTPRVLIADDTTGIGVGMTMFMGNTDMHMFKMYGGQVYAVHAILGGATSSGWE